MRGSNLIHDYSFKPDPKFIGDDKNNLYLGIELEMEIRSGDLNNSAKYVEEKLGNWFYMKQDSSINQGGYRGFELVSHPISFNTWNNLPQFNTTLDYLREHQEARAWDAKSCGLHIHVSRAGFKGGAHVHRWLTLIYKNSPEMISGVHSAIQLAHASIEYTRNLTLSDVKLGMLRWEWFYDYVEANNGYYPDLYVRMSKVRTVSINNVELVNA